MLQLIVKDKNGIKKAEYRGAEIREIFHGELVEGDVIKIVSDAQRYIAVRLDEQMEENFVYIPNRTLTFTVPSLRELKAGYNKNAFTLNEHLFFVREIESKEFYATRNLALNAYDLRQKTGGYPHASANFVTRNEPCFYERNAIDGNKNNQGHGGYPYNSWAGGARNDLEFKLDFGAEVEIDEFVFYLRADFKRDEITGLPHDTYWKSIDVNFSDGETIKADFKLYSSDLNSENQKGVRVVLKQPKRTKTVILNNFTQATQTLGFAALTQIEVYGRYIKEDLSKMEVRQAANAKDVKYYTTERLREEFHIANLFTKDNVRMVYSHVDRIITAGFMPVRQTLKLEAGKELAADYFLQRREMGCINVGGKGIITIDGVEYVMNPRDGIYVGMGNKDISFKSCDENSPAKFYMTSCPAHTTYPTVKIDISKAKKVPCGSAEECNKRVINQYIHPEVMQSCQLAMGLTQLESGSNWNTMPCHTHDRRMEVYMYLDMGENDVVFHMMGEPTETRHIVMHNEEAVISSSWSIHSGVGTKNYSFIWAMCGENQEFTDMDHIENRDLL